METIDIRWTIYGTGTERTLAFSLTISDQKKLRAAGFNPCDRFCVNLHSDYVVNPLEYIDQMRRHIICPMICGSIPENTIFNFVKYDKSVVV